MRIGTPLLAALLALGAAAAPAGAASVAYNEGGNLVLASPDGAQKLTLTSDGTAADPYYGIAQAADGTTVAARLQTFDERRPVLHEFAAADRDREGQGALRKSRRARSVDQNASASHGSSAGANARTSGASSVGCGACVVVAA